MIITKASIKPIPFAMVQSSDHVTPLTGASPTVLLSKNGGSFASPAGVVTEVGHGIYILTPTNVDTNTDGMLTLFATAASGDPSTTQNQVVELDLYTPLPIHFESMGITVGGAVAVDGTSSLTESYAALHTVPTLAQLLFEVRAMLCENGISGTTMTAREINGSTPAETFTLNSATAPTNLTRAT